jgi:peptidylprolyl isomerase
VLSTGTGPDVTAGKLGIVQYTAVDWSGGPLASTWGDGPQGVPIGGQQPSPFDLLAGVPVGSRVLIELPAQEGDDAATQSIAVVIDVLGLHGPAKEKACPEPEPTSPRSTSPRARRRSSCSSST